MFGCRRVDLLQAKANCEVPQDEVMSPALVSQLPQAAPQAGGRVAGKGPVGKDLEVLADSGWM